MAAKYVGAFGMYFIGKLLKKKYQLESDVRHSLYLYCNQWCAAIGKERQFMGGGEPNLADLVSVVCLSIRLWWWGAKYMWKNTHTYTHI